MNAKTIAVAVVVAVAVVAIIMRVPKARAMAFGA
jgi:hypothetical protein